MLVIICQIYILQGTFHGSKLWSLPVCLKQFLANCLRTTALSESFCCSTVPVSTILSHSSGHGLPGLQCTATITYLLQCRPD